jgi:hypothetical protein
MTSEWASSSATAGAALFDPRYVGVARSSGEPTLGSLELGVTGMAAKPLGVLWQGAGCALPTSWASAPEPGKPVRVGLGREWDPVGFNFKGSLGFPMRYSEGLLVAWSSQWAASLVGFSQPLSKLSQGALVRGPGDGPWNETWASDPEVGGLL